eukprot:CAMPEP_0176489168 /NCGR_PEP_ID=MMETSP0200_2-20121128/7133_1 /TAXON_ID=947934 /ORGANISM="Chaetoceros sp., Strain GSL56" /LENGTH=649 /DNA_ID=CAMNT_0017886269 /DNA_START=1551 /DNA_END=3500 /DNA_ORIENTATION=+
MSNTHTQRNHTRETPTVFSTASNALCGHSKQDGELKKYDIHRKGPKCTFHNNINNNMSTPPSSLYYASVPTVSFDHSLPPSRCNKQKDSNMKSTSTTSSASDVQKNTSLGKNTFKRKGSPSVMTTLETSSSKKQKVSNGHAVPSSHAAHPQYAPYGAYPHYPYYYPYYPPPPANMVAAPPPPPPGYTWPYPVAHPAAYPHYYPPHYYHHHHPSVTAQQPAHVTSNHGDKSSKTKKSSGPTTTSTPKPLTHNKALPEKVPSATVSRTPSSESAKIFPPRDVTIHSLHNAYIHTSTSSLDDEDDDDYDDETCLDRRERKNAQSRRRAAKLKASIHMIKAKKPEDRSPEEVAKLETYEERRRRKNGRSRERALERKARFEEISAKPEKEWTDEEKMFMKEHLTAKYRKNEGDRLRRKRMRESGSNASVSVASCALSSAVFSHSKGGAFTRVASAPCPPLKRSNFHSEELQQSGLAHRDSHHSVGVAAMGAAPLTPKNEMELYDDDSFARIFDLSPRRVEEGDEKDAVSHFIFPSPSEDDERLMHSPTLELCAETSILDQNLEDIILSPHFATPRATVSSDDDAGEEIHGVNASFSPSTSPLTLRLMDLPRRSKPEENLYDDAFCTDWRGFGDIDDSNNQHEPIAVSFSMDTI